MDESRSDTSVGITPFCSSTLVLSVAPAAMFVSAQSASTWSVGRSRSRSHLISRGVQFLSSIFMINRRAWAGRMLMTTWFLNFQGRLGSGETYLSNEQVTLG